MDAMPMSLQIAWIVLTGTLFTALGALVGSLYATRTSAKQSELVELRERVDRLFRDNVRYHKENLKLREYIFNLRLVLAKHDIEAPEFEVWSVNSCDSHE